MQDNLNGTIELIIKDPDAVGSVAAGGIPVSTGSGEASSPATKKQGDFFTAAMPLIKRFIPFLAVGGGLFEMVKSSKLIGTMTSTISELMGTILDVFLTPLMPIFVKIMEAITPLIPKVMEFFDAFMSPFVDVLLPVLQLIVDGVNGILDFVEKFDLVQKIKDGIAGLIDNSPLGAVKDFFSSLGENGLIQSFTDNFNPFNLFERMFGEGGANFGSKIAEFFSGLGLLEKRELVPTEPSPSVMPSSMSRLTGSANPNASSNNQFFITNDWTVGVNTTMSVDELMSMVESRTKKVLNDTMRQGGVV